MWEDVGKSLYFFDFLHNELYLRQMSRQGCAVVFGAGAECCRQGRMSFGRHQLQMVALRRMPAQALFAI